MRACFVLISDVIMLQGSWQKRYQIILWWQKVKKVKIVGNHRCMFIQCFLKIKFTDIRLILLEHVTFCHAYFMSENHVLWHLKFFDNFYICGTRCWHYALAAFDLSRLYLINVTFYLQIICVFKIKSSMKLQQFINNKSIFNAMEVACRLGNTCLIWEFPTKIQIAKATWQVIRGNCTDT